MRAGGGGGGEAPRSAASRSGRLALPPGLSLATSDVAGAAAPAAGGSAGGWEGLLGEAAEGAPALLLVERVPKILGCGN